MKSYNPSDDQVPQYCPSDKLANRLAAEFCYKLTKIPDELIQELISMRGNLPTNRENIMKMLRRRRSSLNSKILADCGCAAIHVTRLGLWREANTYSQRGRPKKGKNPKKKSDFWVNDTE